MTEQRKTVEHIVPPLNEIGRKKFIFTIKCADLKKGFRIINELFCIVCFYVNNSPLIGYRTW